MSRIPSRRDGTPIAVTTSGLESGLAERPPGEPPAESPADAALDAPVFVLIPGLGESIRSWGRLPALLSREHPVVAYDLRGHGESGPALSGDYELPAHAADLATVLAEVVPAGTPYVLVGHSWGGAVILRHAADASRDSSAGAGTAGAEAIGAEAAGAEAAGAEAAGAEAIGAGMIGAGMIGAVFVGSSGSAGTLFGFPGGALPRWAQAVIRVAFLGLFRLGAHLRGSRWARPVIDWSAQRLFFGGHAPRDLVEDAAQAFLATDPQVLADTMFASVRQDYTSMGPAVTVPSLVIWGERDREDPRTKVQQLIASLPRARTVTLSDAGHMVPLTHPDRVVEEIGRWLPAVAGSARSGEHPARYP